MIPIKFEKIVRSATFQELWASRKPDFKALGEIRTLKRHGISATHERRDDDTFRVIAQATEVSDINYLVLKRGFSKIIEKPKKKKYSDVVKTILKRPRNGTGGGIPLTRGEVAMLFLDGYAGDHPNLLDIRSQGYGEDCSPPARGGVAEGRGGGSWDGLTTDDVLEDNDTAFVWSKWEPLELFHKQLNLL